MDKNLIDLAHFTTDQMQGFTLPAFFESDGSSAHFVVKLVPYKDISGSGDYETGYYFGSDVPADAVTLHLYETVGDNTLLPSSVSYTSAGLAGVDSQTEFQWDYRYPTIEVTHLSAFEVPTPGKRYALRMFSSFPFNSNGLAEYRVDAHIWVTVLTNETA